MLKNLTTLIFASFMLINLTACDNKKEATTPSTASEAVSVINPHIRAMPPGQKVTAMYFELKNKGNTQHELVTVISEQEISNSIELHTHTNNNGVMQMGEVESIPVGPKSSTIAKPGGYHVMIMGLKDTLKLGEKHNFMLLFKDGSSTEITAEVKTIKMH